MTKRRKESGSARVFECITMVYENIQIIQQLLENFHGRIILFFCKLQLTYVREFPWADNIVFL